MVAGPWDAELLEFDDDNTEHFAGHNVSASEILAVFDNDPLWAANKKGRSGTHLMIGRSNGNRPLVIAVVYDDARRVLRPITARTCTLAEVNKWNV